MSSTPVHFVLERVGLLYGPLARISNFLANKFTEGFMAVFGSPLAVLYFHGPAVMQVGFWQGSSAIDICSKVSSLPADFWSLHREDCNELVFTRFENFVVIVAAIYWLLVVLAAIVKLANTPKWSESGGLSSTVRAEKTRKRPAS